MVKQNYMYGKLLHLCQYSMDLILRKKPISQVKEIPFHKIFPPQKFRSMHVILDCSSFFSL